MTKPISCPIGPGLVLRLEPNKSSRHEDGFWTCPFVHFLHCTYRLLLLSMLSRTLELLRGLLLPWNDSGTLCSITGVPSRGRLDSKNRHVAQLNSRYSP